MIKKRLPPLFQEINQSSPVNNTPFNLGHCIYSSVANANEFNNFPGLDYNPNMYPPQEELFRDNIILSLHKLFKHCINPILERFGSNLALTSVYRNKRVNNLLGGVENSQHIYGYAADMVFYDGTPSSYLFNWCKLYIPHYHQLIWEYPERGDFSPFDFYKAENTLGGGVVRIADPGLTTNSKFSWVHISYIEGNNQKTNSVSSTDPKIHKAYRNSKSKNTRIK